MKRCVIQLPMAAVMAVMLYGSSPVEARGRDYVVECGHVRMFVSDRGYLRRTSVGQTGVLGAVGLAAVCGDKSVKGKGRMYQRCTFWEDSQDVAPRGVQIVRDGEQGRVVFEREGVLAFGRKADAKALAYAQRVEVTVDGKITVEYQIEFLRTLSWSHQPVSIEMHVPMSLAEGASCTMDRRRPRAISETWSKKAQVTGRFQTLQLAGLRVTAGEGAVGSLQDPRAWEAARRSSHQYVAISAV